jgi:hypothetical protein
MEDAVNDDDRMRYPIDDPKALKEMASIRQILASRGISCPAAFMDLPAPVRAEVCTDYALHAAADDAGYGMFNLRRAFVHAQRDGHYRLNRAVSRGAASAVCALCGSDGWYYYH